MKIKEITNAQDQLELLRTIIDNTWTSIKQQADTQARQASTKQVLNKKVLIKVIYLLETNMMVQI